MRGLIELIPGIGNSARFAESDFAGGALEQDRGGAPFAASFPPRPAIPPALACALGLWASCAIVLTAAQGWNLAMCALLGFIGVVGSLVSVAAIWRRSAVLVWSMVLGLALGTCCAAGFAAQQHCAFNLMEGSSGPMLFEALADGSESGYGVSCLARVACSDGSTATVRVLLPSGEKVPRYGDVFAAKASLAAPSEESASYLWTQGAIADVRVSGTEWMERSDLMGALLAARGCAVDAIVGVGGEGAGVLAALVCGWRGDLSDDVYGAFKTTGLAHLVAVSGAHLSLVSAFVAGLLRVLRVPFGLARAAQVAMLLCYLLLAAAPPSAIRAAVMAFVGILSFTARRRPASISALAVCVIGFIGLEPQAALSAAFALSVLSTLGIAVFAGLCSGWIAWGAPWLPRFARDALSLTFASGILATPLSSALFSQLPLVAPLANVLAAPLFAPLCAGGLAAVALSLACPALGPVLLAIACAGSGMLSKMACLLAQIPYASVPVDVPLLAALVLSALLAVGLWMAWPKPRIRAIAALLGAGFLAVFLAVFALPRVAGDEIIMLDVGQGDAFVLRSEGSAVLIDTGNQDRLLREALARHGIFRLDAVIATHGDDDHMGSLVSLAGIVEVGRVLVAADALTCGCSACGRLLSDARTLVGYDGVQGLAAGDRLQVGVFALETIGPERFVDEGGNADSLCLVADADANGDGAGDWRALFVGDAESDQLRELIDSGKVGSVDVYKVGHHGSKKALDDDEAAILSPRIALVSVGAGNRYGHPAQETLDRLEVVGARMLRTDEQGDVSCKLEADRIVIETLR